MSPYYITIATVCIQTLITNGKGVDSQDVCLPAVTQKSTSTIYAKANETVLNVVSKEWIEEQIRLIDKAQAILAKTTDYYFAEADKTYCDRKGHKWRKVNLSWAPKAIAEKCDICDKTRRKAMKEDWIIEP